jgi:conjugative relaxase-like TrwC/TraI family protein
LKECGSEGNMLSVKSFGAADAASTYYSHGDYYGREGEGTWYGKGSAELKLEGKFNAAEENNFKNIISGILPNGQVLGRKAAKGTQRHPGIDLTFSAPKSFSIEMLVNSQGEQREKLTTALQKATQNTLDYIENKGYFTTRKGKNGVVQESIHKLVYSMFAHTTNRNLEPQAHTHCFVANVATCSDGKYRSLNFNSFLQKHNNKTKYIGQVFRNELAFEVKKLGYQVVPVTLPDGSKSFELAHISKEMIKAFSTRRQEIEAICAELGIVTKEGRDKVVINSRKAKQTVAKEALEATWQQIKDNVIKELSVSHQETASKEEVNSSILDKLPKGNELSPRDLALLCIRDVSSKSSTFNQEAINQKIMKFSIGQLPIGQIEAEINSLKQKGLLLQNGALYTTKELLDKEKSILSYGKQNIGHTAQLATASHISRHLKIYEQKAKAQNPKFAFNEQQTAAIEHILLSTDKITAIVGKPGVGKSTIVDAVRAITGRKVISLLGLGEEFKGAAPTASAAKTLGDAASIESGTLHRFIAQYTGYIEGRGKAGRLQQLRNQYSKTILIVDEASMISTDLMWNLLTLREKLNFRLVLIGDDKQLGAVEAGKPFEQLLGVLNYKVIDKILRQQKEVDREAVLAASNGDVMKAFITHDSAMTSIDSGANMDSDAEIAELASQAVNQYMKYPRAEREATLLIAPTRKLRDMINDQVRAQLYENGEIGERAINLTALRQKDFSSADYNFAPEYEVGDTIKFYTNYKRQGINKGEYWRIANIHSSSNSLILEREGREVIFTLRKNSRYDGKLEAFHDINLNLHPGLKIRFTKNDSGYGLINSETAVILDITPETIKFEGENKQVKVLPLSEARHIDYGYCSTIHSAQGKTYDNAIAALSINEFLNNQKSWLVSITRHKNEFVAVLEDKAKVYKNIIGNKGSEMSAIELIERIQQGSISKINAIAPERKPEINHKRYVYIDKTAKALQSNANSSENKVSNTIVIRKSDNIRSYEDFIRDSEGIRALAMERFSDYNAKRSGNGWLRFGSSGKIAVNLRSGQWFDHSCGDGGSLYKLYKEKHSYDLPANKTTMKTIAVSPEISEQYKLKQVNKLIKDSLPLNAKGAELGQQYLKTHRKIDWSQISLSDDIRFTAKAWSSETKTYHPALVSIARDNTGTAKATQVIYLDKSTANKNKELEIIKRSSGVVKSSFVELTRNKEAKLIFIAEGMETALSVAQVQKEARVICSLGINNMQHIDFSREQGYKDKQIIICADNDGTDSKTSEVVANAAARFQEQGIRSVGIIQPTLNPLEKESKGKDFNDVLQKEGQEAVMGYIEPFTKKYPNYREQLTKKAADLKDLENTIGTKRQIDLSQLTAYRDANAAVLCGEQLVQEHGIKKALQLIKENPQILGELKGVGILNWKNAERKSALSNLQAAAGTICKHLLAKQRQERQHQNYMHQKQIYDADLKEFSQRYLSAISNFDDKGLDYKSIQSSLIHEAQKVLMVMDGKVNFNRAKAVTARFAQYLVTHPSMEIVGLTANAKKELFLRAYFEEKRKDQIRNYLLNKEKPQTAGQRLALEMKLDRLLAIDSRHSATKGGIYYQPTALKQVLAEFKLGQATIESLTTKYQQQHMSYSQANFIATEMVKYHERHGVDISAKQLKHVEYISDYVGKHYAVLRKQGLDKQEAKLVYTEGSKMLLNQAHKTESIPSIAQGEVQKIQQASKQEFEGINRQMQQVTMSPKKSLEISL